MSKKGKGDTPGKTKILSGSDKGFDLCRVCKRKERKVKEGKPIEDKIKSDKLTKAQSTKPFNHLTYCKISTIWKDMMEKEFSKFLEKTASELDELGFMKLCCEGNDASYNLMDKERLLTYDFENASTDEDSNGSLSLIFPPPPKIERSAKDIYYSTMSFIDNHVISSYHKITRVGRSTIISTASAKKQIAFMHGLKKAKEISDSFDSSTTLDDFGKPTFIKEQQSA